jgi:membrane protein DedA with SNARE-associated domain
VTHPPDDHAPPAPGDSPGAADTEDEELAQLFDTSHYRVTDKQAIALFVGYLVFRQITARFGLAFPWFAARDIGWAVPLLNNTMLPLVGITASTWTDPGMRFLIGATSVTWSMVTGLVLYWAGWRFGPELAKRAESGHAAWSSIWNPKQVARAHRWLERWGVIAVVLGRIIEFLSTPVALVAGSSRMSLRKYIPAWLVGAFGYAGILIWLGGRAATQWPWLPDRLAGFASWSLRISFILLALLLVIFLLSPKSNKAGNGTSEPS